MRVVIIFLLSSFVWASPQDLSNDRRELQACVLDFERTVSDYQSGISYLTWKFDSKISASLNVLNGLKVTLLWTEDKNTGKIIDRNLLHLLGNAHEGCLANKKSFRQRARVNFWFVYLVPTFFFIFCFGLSLMLSRKEKTNTAHDSTSNNHSFKIVFIVFLFFSSSAALSSDFLTVYTYDALTGKGSLGELLRAEFKNKTGAELKLISFSAEGEALNQIVLEGKSTPADILLGIDSSFASRAESTDLFLTIDAALSSKLEPHLKLGEKKIFLPFDYGFLAFVFNQKRVQSIGSHWVGMTLRKFLASEPIRKKIVIQDPRTSSLGFSFLRWTQDSFKDPSDLTAVWKNLFPKLITVTPGWSGAYGMFLKGEADWVLSYTTSRAYHLEREKNDQYQVLLFDDGHATQVEAAAVVKYSKKEKLIHSFLELLISDEIQAKVPTTQWMYPARKGVKLPESFRKIPRPKAISLSNPLSELERKKMIQQWVEWGAGSR